jgi:hypothetical protein
MYDVFPKGNPLDISKGSTWHYTCNLGYDVYIIYWELQRATHIASIITFWLGSKRLKVKLLSPASPPSSKFMRSLGFLQVSYKYTRPTRSRKRFIALIAIFIAANKNYVCLFATQITSCWPFIFTSCWHVSSANTYLFCICTRIIICQSIIAPKHSFMLKCIIMEHTPKIGDNNSITCLIICKTPI